MVTQARWRRRAIGSVGAGGEAGPCQDNPDPPTLQERRGDGRAGGGEGGGEGGGGAAGPRGHWRVAAGEGGVEGGGAGAAAAPAELSLQTTINSKLPGVGTAASHDALASISVFASASQRTRMWSQDRAHRTGTRA